MRFYLPGAVVTSFADDTALTVIGEYVKDLIEIANVALENLSQFTKHSFLGMNIEKTNYMIFSRIGKVVNNCHSILLQGVSISKVFQCRYLGFYFDVNFSWIHHCKVYLQNWLAELVFQEDLIIFSLYTSRKQFIIQLFIFTECK